MIHASLYLAVYTWGNIDVFAYGIDEDSAKDVLQHYTQLLVFHG